MDNDISLSISNNKKLEHHPQNYHHLKYTNTDDGHNGHQQLLSHSDTNPTISSSLMDDEIAVVEEEETPLPSSIVITENLDFNYDYDDETKKYIRRGRSVANNTHNRKIANTNKTQILAMLSNFSTSYNVINISLVLPMTYKIYKIDKDMYSVFDSLCTSSLIGGMIVGQLVGGTLGDVIGRMKALYIMMICQVISSIGSALSVDITTSFSSSSSDDYTSYYSFYLMLSIWRFILGIGCGGIYPLAAVLSAEGDDSDSSTSQNNKNVNTNNEEEEIKRWKRMACTFSTQGFGFWMAPLVSWMCILIYGQESGIAWRIVLALGSIPGILIIFIKGCSRDSTAEHNTVQRSHICCHCMSVPLLSPQQSNHHIISEDVDGNDHFQEELSISTTTSPTTSSSLYHALCNEPQIIKKLVGTAFIWFLFDILFYGNTLFQPIVLSAALGSPSNKYDQDDLSQLCMDSFILSSIALPGYIVGVLCIGDKQRPKYIQMKGFSIMAILYIIIGTGWTYWKNESWLLLLLYGLTFFFSNYGPNMTTFILPSITYSPSCRSTFNGISAAAGKLGALVGTMLFVPLSHSYGDDFIMFLCAGLAVFSLILTLFCVVDIDESLLSTTDGGDRKEHDHS